MIFVKYERNSLVVKSKRIISINVKKIRIPMYQKLLGTEFLFGYSHIIIRADVCVLYLSGSQTLRTA